jgi:YVTN family beta-propeller protein
MRTDEKGDVMLVRTLVLSFVVALGATTTFGQGHIIVANRGAGSVSVIDTGTDAVLGEVPLPGGGEPMYVVYSPAHNRFFVGDRTNSRLVVFDANTFAWEADVPTCGGVWHMWGDQAERQIWVACDRDNAVSVIDPITLDPIVTIEMPELDGRRPHDVTLDPNGKFAFVTMTSGGQSSWVLQFDTTTFDEVGRVEVGIDAHLGMTRGSDTLYVPTQGSSQVHVLDSETLTAVVPPVPVPNAHGAGFPRNGRVFYTTNLAGGGSGGLVAIDTRTHAVIGAVDTTPEGLIPVPHNVAFTPNGRKVYVTHSGGTATSVTVYAITGAGPIPQYLKTLTVGLNPFGLAYVP